MTGTTATPLGYISSNKVLERVDVSSKHEDKKVTII